MRLIVRRERPHPGAQLSLFEERDGWRYQAVATNTTTGQLAFLEARHRAHARVEDRIRHAKDTGLGRFPSREFAINQAWMLARPRRRPRRLAPAARPARRAEVLAVCEPKALRYRFLHVPAAAHPQRPTTTTADTRTWPWTAAIVAVFANIAAIPPPA